MATDDDVADDDAKVRELLVRQAIALGRLHGTGPFGFLEGLMKGRWPWNGGEITNTLRRIQAREALWQRWHDDAPKRH